MLKNNKKLLSLVLAMIIAFSCFGTGTIFAFDYSYRFATEYTSIVNETISSASNVDWYKFTISAADLPCPYSVTLKTPVGHLYNFDLRYLAPDSDGRPVILPIESVMSPSRNRVIDGVLNQAGTYYIRVFSQDGTSSTLDNYRLIVKHNRGNTYELLYPDTNYTGGLPSDDWSACAEMMAKVAYSNEFYNSTTGRDYRNANVFILSAYEEDDIAYYGDYTNAAKPNAEQTAIAADYVYSGDLMQQHKFEAVTDRIYEIDELMYYLWGLKQGVVFYMDSPDLPSHLDLYKRYVILIDLNIGENTITVYDPVENTNVTMDYDEFLTDGISIGVVPITFRGTSIVEASYARRPQRVYE